MASLGFAQSFFKRLPDLPKDVQKRLPELLGKFEAGTHAGLHLEKPNATADERGRTIRINQFWRGVVMAPVQGDHYVLFDIFPHDDAYEWLANHTFAINGATQEVEIVNVSAMKAAAAKLPGAGADPSPGMFDAYEDAVLMELGIEPSYVPLVRRARSDADLDLLAQAMPGSQVQVLEMLAAGYTVREIRAELGLTVAAGAAAKASPGVLASPTVFIPKGARELQDALDNPLEQWRIFLHPSQRRIAYRDRYAGSVRVTGGAGTGKTVVALHRAHHLARRLPVGPKHPVLVTTFVRTLADDLRANLASLDSVTGVDTSALIEVTTVDALARRVVTTAEGASPKVTDDERTLTSLWSMAAASSRVPFSPAMLRQEWEHVILARGVSMLADYLTVSRAGRSQALNKAQRVEVWTAVEIFLGHLRRAGERTFLQLADDAARYALALPASDLHPHVVVDEAQDLHPAQWRLLRAVVPDAPDDLFIVGDAHQRIYDHRVALTTMGINVRGRSHRLRLNYRTSEEILSFATGLMTGQAVDDLDGGEDSLDGYRSAFRGTQPPTLRGYPTLADELAGLVDTVGTWIHGGIAPSEIGVAARTRKGVDAVVEVLRPGFEVSPLDRKSRGGIEVGTMHRMKGLEYRAMAVVDISARSVPLPHAITPPAVDAAAHAKDTLRELCLLYVACTRAREFLSISWHGEPSPFLSRPGDRSSGADRNRFKIFR